MALAKKVTPIRPTEGVNFGGLDMYAAGGGLPEGDYQLEFGTQMYQAKKQDGTIMGDARLGVMVTCSALDGNDPESGPRTQFYSMGKNAHKSFQPNPQTGKGLVAVPGGGAHTLNNSTNWAIFLKSLYDSGLPEGIFTNDLGVLDGIKVHMQSQPEPVERKQMRGRTGEAAQEEPMGSGMIAVVTEIKDDGKPWEAAGPTQKKVQTGLVGKIAAKAAKPVPAQANEEGVDEDAVRAAAVAGITAVLENEPNGTSKLKLRTGTFKAVSEAYDGDVATAVLETFFGNDEALNSVLGDLGYAVQAGMVKPQ